MLNKFLLALALGAASVATSGCVPLVVGAGAAVAVDTAAEKDGDDGIF